MFVFDPNQTSARLQAVMEGYLDGIMLLTELGGWVHANAIARRICGELSADSIQSNSVPKEIWRVCGSLIESRQLYPDQKMVLESEVITKSGTPLRIRARWLEQIVLPPGQNPAALDTLYLLVVLEDRSQTIQNLVTSHARKYGFTQRQKEVWALQQAGCSYQKIAARLYITINTVKKHIKDVRGKMQEVQAWEEYSDRV